MFWLFLVSWFLVSFGFGVVVVVVASLFVFFTSLKAVVPIQFIVT